MKKLVFLTLLLSCLTLNPKHKEAQASGIPVVDVASNMQTIINQIVNYIEYALQTVNQVEQISNQIVQINDMTKNSAQLSTFFWEDLSSSLQELHLTAQNSDVIAYNLDNLESELDKIWDYEKQSAHGSSREYSEEKAAIWSKTQQNTYKNTLKSVRKQFEQLHGKEKTLVKSLQNASQNSKGRNTAIQVGHQIAIAQIGQSQKNRELLMQLNKTLATNLAMEDARRAATDAARKASTEMETDLDTTNGKTFMDYAPDIN